MLAKSVLVINFESGEISIVSSAAEAFAVNKEALDKGPEDGGSVLVGYDNEDQKHKVFDPSTLEWVDVD